MLKTLHKNSYIKWEDEMIPIIPHVPAAQPNVTYKKRKNKKIKELNEKFQVEEDREQVPLLDPALGDFITEEVRKRLNGEKEVLDQRQDQTLVSASQIQDEREKEGQELVNPEQAKDQESQKTDFIIESRRRKDKKPGKVYIGKIQGIKEELVEIQSIPSDDEFWDEATCSFIETEEKEGTGTKVTGLIKPGTKLCERSLRKRFDR